MSMSRCEITWGQWEDVGFLILIFFVIFQKINKLCLIFWTPIGFWEYEYYVRELVEIDEDINQMKEYTCKF
jgi:hypothetical protein